MVRREDDAEQISYRPTEKGQALAPALGAVQTWADRWRAGDLGARPGRLDGCRRSPR
ncbi:hypothetical protein [Micromonospora auratinigra]|uniref:hypothetical protein n=1 Tax=Micromonospora auratinigra TaxID=261654 RepID=UPI0012FE6E99|nr:hypothetical protein [Micromonospora auratinigra]